MPQIIPMKDLRNTNAISERCHTTREPLFVTKNGYGDLVVMSIEAYEDLCSETAVDRGIEESEAALQTGKEPLDAKEALQTLRRKYFG